MMLSVPVGATVVRVELRRRRFRAGRPVSRLVPGGKYSSLGGQFLGGAVGALADEAHDALAQRQGLFGVVGDAELEEEVCPGHDAEADLAGQASHAVDLGDGVGVHVDDVVQEADGRRHGVCQPVPVDHVRRPRPGKPDQVD